MTTDEKPEEASHTNVLVVQKAESGEREDGSSSEFQGKFGPDGKTLLIPQPSDDPKGNSSIAANSLHSGVDLV
jgi:hypothetical protein